MAIDLFDPRNMWIAVEIVFLSGLYRTQRYKYFRVGGRHLGFRHPVTSDIMYDMAIDMVDPGNMGIAVKIVFLSSLQAVIQVLPV